MGKRFALLIGVSEYGEGLEPLPGSLKDVQAMQTVLQAPDCGTFDVRCLENCDRPTLETNIEQFFGGKAADDVLLLYFSGHGDLGSGGMLHQQLHLCARNTYKQQGRLIESSAMSAGFLKRQMDLSKSQRIAVILDCCYSGAIADLLKKGEGDIDFDELKAKGRVILASSSATKVALQAKDGLSLYTRYLTEGMAGAAYRGQGEWIVARHLHDFAERRFEIESKGGYPPKIIAEDTGFDLPIVRSPKPDPKLTYRKEVDRIFQELDHELGLDFSGTIEDALDRGSLDTLRQRLSLDSQTAIAIEEQVQQPYLARATQRRTYADYFKQAVHNGSLPSDRARRRLIEIRQNLLLGEEDAARIEESLTAQLSLRPAPPPLPTAPKPGGLDEKRSQPTQSPQQNLPLPLESEKGIDYAKLRDLLKAGKWKEADQETTAQMLKAIGKKNSWDVEVDDLLNFPCKDLKTIDRLWVHYSNGKWGFSVQKQIYVECGAKLDGKYPGDKIWEAFGDRVGWRKGGKWSNYDKLTFDLQKSPAGEFPGRGAGVRGGLVVLYIGGCGGWVLFSRTKTCEL